MTTPYDQVPNNDNPYIRFEGRVLMPDKLSLPPQGSMSLDEAIAWEETESALLPELFDSNQLRPVSAVNGCFVAGTLVHTKEGLVPIEQIKVGDWVLSQREMKGEKAYKQVVRTFAYDEKEIILVRVRSNAGGQDAIEQFGVTCNHPFWLKDIGWTRADMMGNGDVVELRDGSDAWILCAQPLFRTDVEDMAWTTSAWGLELNDGSGHRVRLDGDSMPVDLEPSFNFDAPRFKARVFNFEVEDSHTYYVGRLGVWVHNANCGDLGAAPAWEICRRPTRSLPTRL